MVEQQNVFWYYAGNRSASVVINGEPTLASPHKYILAPAGQPWPKPVAHLFRRKTPPKEIVEAFGEGAKKTAEYRKALEAETAQAHRNAQKAERERSAAARKGNVASRMEMADAVTEKGRQDLPSETEPQTESKSETVDPSSPPPPEEPRNETRAQRKKRLKAEKKATADAEAEGGNKDEGK